MIAERLQDCLQPVYERQQMLGWRFMLAKLLGGAIGVGLLFIVLKALGLAPWWLMALIMLSGLAVLGIVAVALWARVYTTKPDYHGVAKHIAEQDPGLHDLLLTALEQAPDSETGKLGYMQQRVLDRALDLGRQALWIRSVPDSKLRWAQVMTRVAGLLLVLVFLGVLWPTGGWSNRPVAGDAAGTESWMGSGPIVFSVQPGDQDVEKGQSVVVLARFKGGPAPVGVRIEYGADESSINELPLQQALKDPVFGGTLQAIEQDTLYRVTDGEHHSAWHKLTVFEHPVLEQADAVITPPTYTKLPEVSLVDTRRVSGAAKSEVAMLFTLNKPVASARLVAEDQSELLLAPSELDPKQYVLNTSLTKTQRYKLYLEDADGRPSKDAEAFWFDVVANLPPLAKLTSPGKDVDVTPLEEVELSGKTQDDYGLLAHGFAYSVDGDEAVQIAMPLETDGSEPLKAEQQLAHLLAMEALNVEPDQLVSIYLWAEDRDEEGNLRRAESDMYFAQIRPFEKEFRQGVPPPPPPSGEVPPPADELLKLQKEVINATWKVIRNDKLNNAQQGLGIQDDVLVLVEGQEAVLAAGQQMLQRLQDAQMIQTLNEAMEHMRQAVVHLEEAAPLLKPAISQEQKAYQDLLRMRARRVELIEQQQQSQGGSGQPQDRQEMEEFRLKQEDRRYETQQQAEAEREQALNEESQALARLKALARRQGDLNEQLKELQAALDAEEEEAEKERLKRELARLSEQQEQLLRDIEEAQREMENSSQRMQQAEARQSLQEARSQAQDAAQALEAGDTQAAINAGTRAERELEETKDALQDSASSQFADAMRDLRRDADALREDQQAIADAMQHQENSKRGHSLSEANDSVQLSEALKRQQERVEDLTRRMQRVSEVSEDSEPVLSRRLEDTLRDTDVQEADTALERTRMWMDNGFMPQAGEAQAQAQVGVNQLAQGVREAAEAVLGNDAQSLARAEQTLRGLREALEQEHSENSTGRGQEARADRGSQGQGEEGSAGQGAQETPQEAEGQQGQGGQSGQESEQDQEGQGSSSGDQGDAQGESQEGEGQEGEGQEPGQGQGQGEGQSQSPSEQAGGQGQNPGQGQGESPEAGQGSSPSQSAQASGGASSDLQPNAPGDQGGAGLGGAFAGPLQGGGFKDWADRLRDLQDMLPDTQMQSDAAQLLSEARSFRADLVRRSLDPDWQLVQRQLLAPMRELEAKIAEARAELDPDRQQVRLDRDPVPERYQEMVQRYYEKLGQGESNGQTPSNQTSGEGDTNN